MWKIFRIWLSADPYCNYNDVCIYLSLIHISVYPGMYVDKSVVEKDIWSALAIINGELYNGEPYYTDETIYFAVKVGWDVK